MFSISSKDVSCIDFGFHIIQTYIIAVGDNGVALFLKGCHVVYYLTTKEGTASFEGWLIDDILFPLTLMRFRMPWMADWRKLSEFDLIVKRYTPITPVVLLGGIEAIVIGIAVVACLLEDCICDVVLTHTITLHDSLDEVLGYVSIVCQELLCVLW